MGIPACFFAAGLDAPLRFVRAHEAEGETADGRHILGAVAGAVAREVVLELDVEQPVHAFDAPMAAGGGGEALDVAGSRGYEIAGIEAAAIGIFGAGIDLDDGPDIGEARLARIVSIRDDPIYIAGSRVGARLDPAMALLDHGLFADEFAGGGGAEIVLDIGFEGGLVALEGEQIVGLVG